MCNLLRSWACGEVTLRHDPRHEFLEAMKAVCVTWRTSSSSAPMISASLIRSECFAKKLMNWKAKKMTYPPDYTQAKLCGVVPVANLNCQAEFFEQPFRHITSVSVALTPYLQLTRRGICFGNEAQMPHYDFKLSCSSRDWRRVTAPVRIPTTVAHTSRESVIF